MRATAALRERYARLTARGRVRLGSSLIAAGIVITVVYLVLDGPVVAFVVATVCVSTGSSLVGTEYQRRGVEQDRQARERRIAEQRRPWPGSEAGPGNDPV